MRKSLLKFGVLAAIASAVMVPAIASADDHPFTFRAEYGVPIPLNDPQVDRFNPGGELILKPTIGLTPWLDASVVGSGMLLPSKLSGIDAGTVFGGGLGLRIKRPHDDTVDISPWLDADAQAIGTGPLGRFAFSVGAGVSAPLGSIRNVWVGPFIRYTDIVDSTDTRVGFNNSDAQVLTIGLDIEFGPRAPKREPAAEPVPCTPPPVVQVEVPVAPPTVVTSASTEVIHMQIKVQFPFDSAIPLPESVNVMQKAATTIMAENPASDSSIELDGHASSEGQVEYNNKLAVRRAQAVSDYLVSQGIPRDRLTVKGFGSRIPVASNATEAGRVKNRRVEFQADVTIVKKAGSK